MVDVVGIMHVAKTDSLGYSTCDRWKTITHRTYPHAALELL